MNTSVPTPPTIAIDKEALFVALCRIYQLMESADPEGNLVGQSDEMSTVVFTGAARNIESRKGDDPWSEPPTLFDDLFDACENFSSRFVGEHIGLFALLSGPIEDDPVLRKEFEEYTTRNHGFVITFKTSGKFTKQKPHLSVVRPDGGTDDDPPSS
jgi:hypothetical protein